MTIALASKVRGSAVQVAQALLGVHLVHRLRLGNTFHTLRGRIVETEAYDETDAASHSCRGRTSRNLVMFGPAGRAYVYRSYGLHWCLNVVCGAEGFGAAVLLRALQPLAGQALMKVHRTQLKPTGGPARGAPQPTAQALCPEVRLARGPGCLTQAMGIDASHYGCDLLDTADALRLEVGDAAQPPWVATPRIGISQAQEALWRFCVVGSPYVSGKKVAAPSASPQI